MFIPYEATKDGTGHAEISYFLGIEGEAKPVALGLL